MSSTYMPSTGFVPMAAPAAVRPAPLLSQGGIAMLLLGVASGIPVQAVGRLFVGELVLMAISPIVVLLLFGLSNQYGKTARLILIAMMVGCLGYVISDMVRGTPSNDYLRGWSRWIAMGASFSTLAWLGSKNIGWIASFLIGLSIGNCLSPFVMYGSMGSGLIIYWKFYAGVPVCLIVLVLVSRFPAWVTIASLVGLTVATLVLDSRSIALLCLITAGITFLGARRSSKKRAPLTTISKSSIAAASAILAGFFLMAIWAIQYAGVKYGLTERFERSNNSRMISARVTWSAIQRSPIIGYGSWPRDAELARERDRLVIKSKATATIRTSTKEDLIIAHSQILQGWLEGGVLGLTFFALLGWQLARQLLWLTFKSPFMPLTSVIVFLQLHCAWHLVFSPFSGAQRVYIPAACVFICYIAQQASQLEQLRQSFSLSFARRPRWAAT